MSKISKMVTFDHDGLSNTEENFQSENLKIRNFEKNISLIIDDGRGLKLKFHRFFNR